MRFGHPASETVIGTMIQASGQKVIVYAFLGSVMIQAHGAKAMNKSSFPPMQ
jgi:hypothetical protein